MGYAYTFSKETLMIAEQNQFKPFYFLHCQCPQHQIIYKIELHVTQEIII